MQEQADYNVLISWSGERSKAIATILHKWLPTVVQSSRPFMSDLDIEMGQRWQAEIAEHLGTLRVGVFVITPENRDKPWVNFEAGAISRKVNEGSTMSIIVGMDRADLTGPLTQFQNALFTESDMKKLALSINKALGRHSSPEAVETVFDYAWSRLKVDVDEVPVPEGVIGVGKRGIEEKVDEMLEHVRFLANELPKTFMGIAAEIDVIYDAVSRDRLMPPRRSKEYLEQWVYSPKNVQEQLEKSSELMEKFDRIIESLNIQVMEAEKSK